MSHLHIPDGILPLLFWLPAFAAALLLLALASLVERRAGPQQIAFRGALGALVLAAMSIRGLARPQLAYRLLEAPDLRMVERRKPVSR